MKNIGQLLSWVGVALVTLVPIINPVSTAGLLLGISAHLSPKERNRQIMWACIYMTGILVTFLLLGHFVMVSFGISIPVFALLVDWSLVFSDSGCCSLTTVRSPEKRNRKRSKSHTFRSVRSPCRA